nr:MAG TPA: transcription factor IIS-like protein [Caudoviricetes sp.]
MNVCPVCGSKLVHPVMLKFKSDPEKWRAVIQCDKCGIVYKNEKVKA